MNQAPDVVSHEQWIEARKRLLEREKEFTRLRDQLSGERRALPWERVDARYVFEGASGRRSLNELFDGRSQLVVYHFMYGPNEDQHPCKSCSFWADNFERSVPHLQARDVTLVAVSRAPFAKLQAFQKRMGWTFPWYSSAPSDFNFDYRVSFRPDEVDAEKRVYNFGTSRTYGTEMPGVSVFYRDSRGQVFHTYSAYLRGIDMLNNTYQFLDLVPKGRDEAGLPHSMAWVRYHDDY